SLPVKAKPETDYGLAKEIQEQLAGIRTDLDSFSEVEAFALMTSGYRMAEYEYAKCIEETSPPPTPAEWPFLKIEAAMKAPADREGYLRLLKLLEVGRSRAFKVWRLSF